MDTITTTTQDSDTLATDFQEYSRGEIPADWSRPARPIDHSSWISAVLYRSIPTPDGPGRFLAIFLRTEPGDIPVALLYAGPGLPTWLCGLILAGARKAGGTGERSVGRAYNILLKAAMARGEGWAAGIRYQRVEGRERVAELRRMMEDGRG